LPFLIIGLLAGVIIDRNDRRRILIGCDVARLISVGSVPIAWWFGALTIPQLYVVALVQGASQAFANLAQVSALPRVVTRAQITAAQAFNQASNGVATVLGPALGATIIGLGATTPAGAAYGYSFDVMTYAFSMIALVSVATRLQAPRAATGPDGSTGLGRLRADIAEGLRYLWNDPDLQGMMAMNFVHRMLLGSLVLGAIVLAQSTLKASTQEIGWVLTAGGGGSLVAAFVATRLRARFAIWPLMIVVVFANAAGFAILAGAPHIFVAMAGMAVATFCESLTGIVQVAFRLAAIPDALQGRVNSAYRWVAYTGMTVGAAGGGFMLDHLGPRSALAIAAGAMGGLGVAVLGLRVRRTRTHPPAIATG
jgi:predicted MFS family arabinose efflux permease